MQKFNRRNLLSKALGLALVGTTFAGKSLADKLPKLKPKKVAAPIELTPLEQYVEMWFLTVAEKSHLNPYMVQYIKADDLLRRKSVGFFAVWPGNTGAFAVERLYSDMARDFQGFSSKKFEAAVQRIHNIYTNGREI